MTQNLLKLNDNKTNIKYLVSPHCVKSLKTKLLQLGASAITTNESVINLGVIFDQCITCTKMSHQSAELPITILTIYTV